MASNWRALGASVRGNWHEHSGQKNQDAVRVRKPAFATDALCLAVSDGHGSGRSFRSDRGSAIATECTLRLLTAFIRRHGSNPSLSAVRAQVKTKWPRVLLAEWRKAVRKDVARQPFSPLDFALFPERPPVIKPGEEMPELAYLAYGATLLAVAVTRRYIFYVQLGDGDIVMVSTDGLVSRPWPRKHKFHANETASLCTSYALPQFETRVEPLRAESPALIMLSTDGYANCFGDDYGFFQVGADFLEYLRRDGVEGVAQKLEGWLRESSRDGSGDDITVALAVRMSALRHPAAAAAAGEARS